MFALIVEVNTTPITKLEDCGTLRVPQECHPPSCVALFRHYSLLIEKPSKNKKA